MGGPCHILWIGWVMAPNSMELLMCQAHVPGLDGGLPFPNRFKEGLKTIPPNFEGLHVTTIFWSKSFF